MKVPGKSLLILPTVSLARKPTASITFAVSFASVSRSCRAFSSATAAAWAAWMASSFSRCASSSASWATRAANIATSFSAVAFASAARACASSFFSLSSSAFCTFARIFSTTALFACSRLLSRWQLLLDAFDFFDCFFFFVRTLRSEGERDASFISSSASSSSSSSSSYSSSFFTSLSSFSLLLRAAATSSTGRGLRLRPRLRPLRILLVFTK
mmetsp:Transcript_46936/g.111520  ORF Transcript_46936/g.111520 Transcript_46936/m.111520 type:complete len:213 (+) Transcript_46936:93-731(+)